MENTKLLITIGASAAILTFLSWLIYYLIKIQKHKKLNTLISCFGEPSYCDLFSLSDVKQWVKLRENKLQNNCKAVVLKANSKNLSTFEKEFTLNDDGKEYLVIAIVSNDKQIKDSVLIQYNKLDNQLENVLAKGDGVLVIGG